MAIVRSGFALELRSAIYQAQQHDLPVTKTGLRVTGSEQSSSFNLQVIPFRLPDVDESHFLVLFEDVPIDLTVSQGDLEREIARVASTSSSKLHLKHHQ